MSEPSNPEEISEPEVSEPGVAESEAAEPEATEPGVAEVAGGPALKNIVEALVFASQKPISAKEIAAALRGAAEAAKENPVVAAFAKPKENEIIEAIDALSADYQAAGHAFEIRETAAGWQLVSAPPFSPWLRQLFPESKPARLSAPALETLAIIAYRQPATRADLEAVRGVAVDGVMQTLLDKQLIRIAGRADIPGRPLLYETTSHFMEHFGLRNLEELPNASELRRAAAELAAASAEKAAESGGKKTAKEPAAAEPAPAESVPAEAASTEPAAGEPAIEEPAAPEPATEIPAGPEPASEDAIGEVSETTPEPESDPQS
ncbi:MAG TPA: SMC-Scp complex subunit ScpB [Chthoniobacterales bacterium]|nr:SMC-Scp complex subunit ScpB [Chthoniobacterales bacterium]